MCNGEHDFYVFIIFGQNTITRTDNIEYDDAYFDDYMNTYNTYNICFVPKP